MDKLNFNCVQLTAHDAIIRALLKTMREEEFSKFSRNLMNLWVDIRIPKQPSHIQHQLLAAMELCDSLIKSAVLDRSQL